MYPSENRKLAAELAANDLLISEFPMGSIAFPQNFPIRNRIISGMSVGVLVVEGAVQRLRHYREAGDGSGPRGVRGTWKYHFEVELGS